MVWILSISSFVLFESTKEVARTYPPEKEFIFFNNEISSTQVELKTGKELEPWELNWNDKDSFKVERKFLNIEKYLKWLALPLIIGWPSTLFLVYGALWVSRGFRRNK